MSRNKGRVKWFNPSKGIGFIEKDNGEDVFVHHSSLSGLEDTVRSLRVGQAVEFEVKQGAKGPMASKVVTVDLI